MQIKSILKYLINSVLILLAILVCVVFYVVYQAKGDIEQAPDLFDYKVLTVLSNSMKPEFQAGDLIVIHVSKKPQLGDIITYKQQDGMLVTHRIKKAIKGDGGETRYVTKGDHNNASDRAEVLREQVIGTHVKTIPNAGYVAKFAAGPYGFFLLVIVPLLLLLILEIFTRLGLVGTRTSAK